MRNPDVISKLRNKAGNPAQIITIEQQVWLSVYTELAGAFGVTDGETCMKWADKAVERFNDRFGTN